MPDHSEEPWQYHPPVPNLRDGYITDTFNKTVVYYEDADDLDAANFCRIVACVNFCKGIPPDDLNHGLGVFAQAYLDYRQRVLTPKVTEAIFVLKEGGT